MNCSSDKSEDSVPQNITPQVCNRQSERTGSDEKANVSWKNSFFDSALLDVDEANKSALVEEFYNVNEQPHFRPLRRCSVEKPPMYVRIKMAEMRIVRPQDKPRPWRSVSRGELLMFIGSHIYMGVVSVGDKRPTRSGGTITQYIGVLFCRAQRLAQNAALLIVEKLRKGLGLETAVTLLQKSFMESFRAGKMTVTITSATHAKHKGGDPLARVSENGSIPAGALRRPARRGPLRSAGLGFLVYILPPRTLRTERPHIACTGAA
eukprot:IDg8827t1